MRRFFAISGYLYGLLIALIAVICAAGEGLPPSPNLWIELEGDVQRLVDPATGATTPDIVRLQDYARQTVSVDGCSHLGVTFAQPNLLDLTLTSARHGAAFYWGEWAFDEAVDPRDLTMIWSYGHEDVLLLAPDAATGGYRARILSLDGRPPLDLSFDFERIVRVGWSEWDGSLYISSGSRAAPTHTRFNPVTRQVSQAREVPGLPTQEVNDILYAPDDQRLSFVDADGRTYWQQPAGARLVQPQVVQAGLLSFLTVTEGAATLWKIDQLRAEARALQTFTSADLPLDELRTQADWRSVLGWRLTEGALIVLATSETLRVDLLDGTITNADEDFLYADYRVDARSGVFFADRIDTTFEERPAIVRSWIDAEGEVRVAPLIREDIGRERSIAWCLPVTPAAVNG